MTSATPCRSCGETGLKVFLDLGATPLADRLVKPDAADEHEPLHPLLVGFCPTCTMVQITETVPPEVLFQDDYPYYSSFSPALLEHSRDNVLDLIERRKLCPNSMVVELASNDGYLLKNYVEQGIGVLGIDPAEGPAQEAEKIGVETLVDFFGVEMARKLKAERGLQADVIHGNNVLAHVADTNGFVAGIAEILHEDGVVVIEAPYVKELIERCAFDTIYHEHLLYLSVTSFDKLFRRHGLYLNEVKPLDIHGGSLRYYAEKKENVGTSVETLLARERAMGVDSLAYYADFGRRVEELRQDLVGLLRRLRADGRRIAAYGAAAKGATLINTMDIDAELVEYVVDRNVHKQGLLMPGQHQPIFAPEKLAEDMPDDVLLLTWNFADEILAQQSEYLDKGGRFIVPIPRPELVDREAAAARRTHPEERP